jgi:hypothetical protein
MYSDSAPDRRPAARRNRLYASLLERARRREFEVILAYSNSRRAEIDNDRKVHKPLIVLGQTVTGMTSRVAWRQGLEMVGYVEGQDNEQRGIAAQRAMLAQHVDLITVGPVSKRGSHTFDGSTVSISWRTPVGTERPAAPAGWSARGSNSNSADEAPQTSRPPGGMLCLRTAAPRRRHRSSPCSAPRETPPVPHPVNARISCRPRGHGRSNSTLGWVGQHH